MKKDARMSSHGRARVISGAGCVIAWWEAGENEATPSIKASAVDGGSNHWTVCCSISGGAKPPQNWGRFAATYRDKPKEEGEPHD